MLQLYSNFLCKAIPNPVGLEFKYEEPAFDSRTFTLTVEMPSLLSTNRNFLHDGQRAPFWFHQTKNLFLHLTLKAPTCLETFLFSYLSVTLPLSIGWWVLVSSHRCLDGCLFKTHMARLIFFLFPLMDLTDLMWILWPGKWLVSRYGIGFGVVWNVLWFSLCNCSSQNLPDTHIIYLLI